MTDSAINYLAGQLGIYGERDPKRIARLASMRLGDIPDRRNAPNETVRHLMETTFLKEPRND